MALLTEWSEENRVITDGLLVSYETQLIFGKWIQISEVGGAIIAIHDKAWTTTRTATKRYKYVGMDLDTAKSCAEDMVDLYTRAFKQSRWNALDGVFDVTAGGSRCMAKVTVKWVQGEMYDVEVEVSEVDTRTTLTEGGKYLFSAEDNRDYDDEEVEA